MTSFVYVVQNHLRYDSENGELKPRYDVSPAEEFGKLRFLLSPRATLHRPEETIAQIRLRLTSFSDRDYLLLIGHPVFIGWATVIAAQVNHGRVRLLVWSGKERRYAPVESNLMLRP